MSAPLIVTSDETLLDELLRLSAAAGVVPEVAADGPSALRAWAAAPAVLVGADLADECARTRPPRRAGVHVVAWGAVADGVFRSAVAVGAEDVAELPRSAAWVIERLSDLEEVATGLTIGVIGGSGGAGASIFACALGQVAARTGLAALVDADPLGAGLDRVLGCETTDGVRWEALQQTTGRLSARSLRDALPRRDGLGVLTWSKPAASLQAFAVREALSAAQRGHELVVVDLPRRVDRVTEEVISRCDHLFVVVAATVVGVAAAARLRAQLGPDRALSLVVRRPGIDAREVGRVVGAPVTVELPDQRRLGEAIDLGTGPVRSHRGRLGRAAAAALDAVRPSTSTGGAR